MLKKAPPLYAQNNKLVLASRDYDIIEIHPVDREYLSRVHFTPCARSTAVLHLKTAGTSSRGKYHHRSSADNRRTGKKDQIKRRANIYEVYK